MKAFQKRRGSCGSNIRNDHERVQVESTDPNSQQIMEEQLEQFFFGAGAQLPEGYVPPKAKS